MALADAYANVAEYRFRTGDQTAGDDATLNAQLLSASRLIERELGRNFNQTVAATARYFDSDGSDVLWVDDLVSVAADGIDLDTANDWTWTGEQLSSGVAGVVLEPYNAAEMGEPYTRIRLVSHSASLRSFWPTGLRSVRVTGVWGWPAVPGMVKELVIHTVHDLRLAHLGGAMAQLPALDENLPLRDDTWRIWRSAKQEYRRKIPVVA